MFKRLIAVLLCAVMMLPVLSAAADGAAWTCSNCGQAGNTTNFCPNCGMARPDESWTCASCGQAGNTTNFCPNCGAPRLGAGDSGFIDPYLEKIPGETEWVKVRIQSVTASRYIEAGADGLKWAPEKAADGDESTCWQFSSAGKSTLTKSWLDLTLPVPRTVDGVWFKNGFWAYSTQGRDQYSINARPRDIALEFRYAGREDFIDRVNATLADDPARTGWQKIPTGRHDDVTGVRIWVYTYFPGTEFPNDVCLSEVMPVQYGNPAYAADASATVPPTEYESRPMPTQAYLKDRISSRSGPSTAYEEPGTFFSGKWQGQTVTVVGKAYTSGVWWVEVDFDYGNARYRVWTGLKRVDVDLDLVPDKQKPIGKASVAPTDAWYGPGGNYAKSKVAILFPEDEIDLYGRENGYVQVDFYDVNREFQRRVWVPQSALSNVIWY